MSRCKICDTIYHLNYIARFPDEDYCPSCEAEISLCLMELEDFEEEENDAPS